MTGGFQVGDGLRGVDGMEGVYCFEFKDQTALYENVQPAFTDRLVFLAQLNRGFLDEGDALLSEFNR